MVRIHWTISLDLSHIDAEHNVNFWAKFHNAQFCPCTAPEYSTDLLSVSRQRSSAECPSVCDRSSWRAVTSHDSRLSCLIHVPTGTLSATSNVSVCWCSWRITWYHHKSITVNWYKWSTESLLYNFFFFFICRPSDQYRNNNNNNPG